MKEREECKRAQVAELKCIPKVQLEIYELRCMYTSLSLAKSAELAWEYYPQDSQILYLACKPCNWQSTTMQPTSSFDRRKRCMSTAV